MKMAAFLRAVNVVGKNKVSMSDLTDLFRSLGFKDVQTYIQSGNVVFEGENDARGMEERIEKAIAEQMGLKIQVVVRSKGEIIQLLKRNPFKGGDYDGQYFHVTMLKKKAVVQNLPDADERKMKNEEYRISGKNIYLYCPNGYGRTQLNNSNLEKWSNQSGTTRNWRTIQAMHDMMNM